MYSADLSTLRTLYAAGANIIDYLTTNGVSRLEAIEISYDLQAGTYSVTAAENPKRLAAFAGAIAGAINGLDVEIATILGAGVGEATTLAAVLAQLRLQPSAAGFDLSWSRIKYGQRWLHKHRWFARLFVGDLFSIPLPDDSIDVVFTAHAIEPNGGREKDALCELYRVARKFVVLCEPCYEIASEEGRQRMERLGYVRDLPCHAAGLKMDVMRCEPIKSNANPLNPAALTLIVKNPHSESARETTLACPITRRPLRECGGFFWSPSSLRAYPIIGGVPMLTPKHGLVATHADEF
jgi:uncharacterized protein YbaR (Trm112 family)